MSARAFAVQWRGVRKVRAPTVDAWLVAAVVALLSLVVLAAYGVRLAPHEASYFVIEHGTDPRPYDPGVVFPFGSDVLGRDILSLVLAGAGSTLTIIAIGGVARVLAGVTLAALGAASRPLGLLLESVAELVSAIPATLVALVVVRILVKADTTIFVFVGALLIVGWAGPYRVIRAEIDRLAVAQFTTGARALGASSWRVLWRHQLPHLVPTIAINLAQQTVASLVLVAELGVLGTFVGTTRDVGIEESLPRVITGIVNFARIADPPEWGGLLAGSRTVESLWTTRWLIFVPGVAFAFTALAIATIGFALSRRYATHDVIGDLRGRGTALLVVSVAALIAGSTLVPERYADARAWASDARAQLAAGASDRGLSGAPLSPLTASAPSTSPLSIERVTSSVLQTAGATVTVGSTTLTEPWPRDTHSLQYKEDVRSFVDAMTGGGTVEAPLVFAARGIVPAENPPPAFRTLIGLQNPELGTLIANYADDYANIDVRGKVVMVVKFDGFNHVTYDANGRIKTQSFVFGIGAEDSIARAIKGGAAAVLFVDPDLPFYTDTFISTGLVSVGKPSPFARAERNDPATATSGVPVVLLSAKAASGIVVPLGVDIGSLYGTDDFYARAGKPSLSRELGVIARVSVPLAKAETRSTSVAGEVAGTPSGAAHILVWAVREGGTASRTDDVLSAVARSVAPRKSPFIFVSFDPSGETAANEQLVRDAVGDRRISLVLVVLDVDGDALEFTTPNGELILALDEYATASGARHTITRSNSTIQALGAVAPLQGVRTVMISGHGADGDLRPDAAAFLGYLAGRLALGAEELPR